MYLEKTWNIKPIELIAKHLNKSVNNVNQRLLCLGLIKLSFSECQGKSYRKCLSPNEADRMELFLRLLAKVKQLSKTFNRTANINLWEMRKAFNFAEGKAN